MNSFLSLKHTCVEAIAKHFDTLLVALNKEKNRNVKELLQRQFSDQLFHQVKKPLQKRHATFLINVHLRNLNMGAFILTDVEAVIEILKIQGKGILDLKLQEPKEIRYLEKHFLQLASSLPSSLRTLELQGTECSDAVLKIVMKTCSRLHSLILDGCNVTDEGLRDVFSNIKQVANLTLRRLHLSNTVTVEGLLVVLNSCPNLTDLSHEDIGDILFDIYNYHTDNNISPFPKYKLEVLYLKKGLHLQASRALCPNVEFLFVADMGTQDQMNDCGHFQKLKDITLFCSGPLSLSPFLEVHGSDLEELIVSNSMASLESLIKLCPNIESLGLYKLWLANSEKIILDATKFSLQNLKILTIGQMKLDTEARPISALFAYSPNIEIIRFHSVSNFTHEFTNSMVSQGPLFVNFIYIYKSNLHASIVEKLIKAAPHLKCILIENCINISRSDCQILEQVFRVRVNYIAA